jgi:hypothetical protein
MALFLATAIRQLAFPGGALETISWTPLIFRCVWQVRPSPDIIVFHENVAPGAGSKGSPQYCPEGRVHNGPS